MSFYTMINYNKMLSAKAKRKPKLFISAKILNVSHILYYVKMKNLNVNANHHMSNAKKILSKTL
jgi:hypothetical protein